MENPLINNTVAIACDHAGLTLKTALLTACQQWGVNILDLGVNNADSVDYPDYAVKVVQALQRGECHLGILVCGTGIGMSITANRFADIRAAVLHNEFEAGAAREHNNVNVACFGGRVIGESVAISCLKTFLLTSFAGGRHQQRLDKIQSHCQ